MYQVFTIGPYTCPALNNQYWGSPWTTPSGTILSIGVQNIGLNPLFYTSQAFVLPGGKQAMVQVANNGFSSITWYAYAVVDTGGAADLAIQEPQLPEVTTQSTAK